MKKTKIICTLGPATDDEKVLSDLVDAGMNAARLNFSHGTYEEHAARIAAVKKVRDEKCVPLPIILDTKGPEFRLKQFEGRKVHIEKGQTFTFTTDDIMGDSSRVAVTYEKICEQMKEGDKILVNDGLLTFEVKSIEKPNVVCEALNSGDLSDRKSMYFPDKLLDLEYLSEQDKADIKFGVEMGVDFLALSFVSKAQDVRDVKGWLEELGVAEGEIELIAKIESRAGVNNIDEIMDECQGIMVARGDLGVEVPYEELPGIQKDLIKRCRVRGKLSVTATEMLESMTNSPRPTRAEISDVANAVFDGSSAIMLSGETAAGKYPALAVAAMARIAEQAEGSSQYFAHVDLKGCDVATPGDALSHSACTLAEDIGAKVIVACTRSGRTARLVSRFRPKTDIIGMTTSESAYRRLALSWGVLPVMAEEFTSVDVLFHYAKIAARESGLAKKGDLIVMTGGSPNGKSGNSNLINIDRL